MRSNARRGAHGAVLPLLALWLLAPAPPATAQEEADLIDGIAAQVGGDIVLISEVNQVARPAEARMREAGAAESDVAMLRAEVLERLIERALVRQVVQRAELDATEEEVDDAIFAIAEENDISPEELRQSVEAQGLPFEFYRERIRSEIEQSKVVNGMVASRVRIEEDEVRALYDKEFADQPSGGTEVHLRHILVPFDPDAPGEQKERACSAVRAALARVAAGEPFPEVATGVTAINPRLGGDLGWIHERELAGWMAPEVARLEEGQVSGVLEMPFGCNALQLVERREFQPLGYEEAREGLRRQLFNERMAEEYASFLEDLRDKTFIDRKGIYADAARLDPSLPGASAPGEPDLP